MTGDRIESNYEIHKVVPGPGPMPSHDDYVDYRKRDKPIDDPHGLPKIDLLHKLEPLNDKQYDRAFEAINGPDRPEPANMSPQEKKDADQLAQLARAYYGAIADRSFSKSGELFNEMQGMFAGKDKEAVQRLIDAANARIGGDGLRFAAVPESGQVWLGRKGPSEEKYHIGALVRPDRAHQSLSGALLSRHLEH